MSRFKKALVVVACGAAASVGAVGGTTYNQPAHSRVSVGSLINDQVNDQPTNMAKRAEASFSQSTPTAHQGR